MEPSARWIDDELPAKFKEAVAKVNDAYERLTDKDFNLKCYKCHEVLKQPGALLFSPPFSWHDLENCVIKYHICTECCYRWMGLK